MEPLRNWLRRRAELDSRTLSVESALLSGEFPRYAARRLLAFWVTRLVAIAAHVVELTFLLHIFNRRAQVASLALANVSFAAQAFWWGALEVMRVDLRAETSRARIWHETTRWLTRSLWLALGATALPLVVSALRCQRTGRPWTVLDAYAALCGVRLAVDLVTRTYYSGAYSRQRIYRPLVALVIADPIGLGTIWLLWRHLGGWSFPIGLTVSLLISRGIVLYYTTQAYRMLRQPLPQLRLRRLRSPKRSPRQLKRVLLAGAASLSTRLGPTLVLAALVRATINDEGLDPLALTLHLAGPLVGATASWTQMFYHDFKRLEDDLAAGLRRRLERRLGWLAGVVAVGLWLTTVAAALVVLSLDQVLAQVVALLPLYGALSYLSMLQLRDFVRGDFSRLTFVSLTVCAALAGVLLIDAPHSASRLSIMVTGGLMLGSGLLAVLGTRARTPPAGSIVPSLYSWLRRLQQVRSQVYVGCATLSRATAQVGLITAERVAPLLGKHGAMTILRAGRRLVWFELPPVRIGARELAIASAGRLASIQRTPVAPDGQGALAAAIESGVFNRPSEASCAASLESLMSRFREQFPEGVILDLARPRNGLAALPVPVRTPIWRDAMREARTNRVARQQSGFEVTTYRPGGEIRLVFAALRPQPRERSAAWRAHLEAANWEASGALADRIPSTTNFG